MKRLFIIFILVGGINLPSLAQLYLPLESYFQGETERFQQQYSSIKGSHTSLQPVNELRTNADSIYYTDSKHYYWITQKLFKENFLIFKGDDFWCAVDPIVDLEAGTDLASDSSGLLYWNTRGIRVQARFSDKVAFTTMIYENQAIVPEYQRNYFTQHGEFYPKTVGYIQNNGVVPGYARTKPFKTDGFDFAFAQGALSIQPIPQLNLQLGNGNHFIGNGYRSMLLSDFTANYPFFKIESDLWQDRIQYTAIYALHQNLYRLPAYSTPEANYERKIGTYHYLDIAITPKFTLGLFEGAAWRRTDSTGTHQPDLLFLNPLPFINGAINGTESTGFNAVYGLNTSLRLGPAQFYAQLVMDRHLTDGVQAGVKVYDLLTGLDLRAEYNKANRNTYLSSESRYNYSHYNLPLAHPYGAGFQEIVVQADYKYKRWFGQYTTNYSQRLINDTLNVGTSVLTPYSDQINPSDPTYVWINRLEFGYRFNKRYNLQAVVGILNRQETYQKTTWQTNYVYFAVRTRLKNKILDW